MKSKLINDYKEKTYALILKTGEEAIHEIQKFAEDQKLSASQFTAIGAFRETEVGFFDFSIKDYKKTPFHEQMEVLSINGDITLFQEKYKVHAHVVLGRKDGTAHGGHLLKGIVHPTLEIIIHESPQYLQRATDKETGLALIKIG